jgi:hypothetical protein
LKVKYRHYTKIHMDNIFNTLLLLLERNEDDPNG